MATTERDAVLGIDLGTSVVKAAVHTLDGAVHGTGSQPVALHRHGGGRVEQDLDDFYAAAAAATRQCLAASGISGRRIAGMAVAGQMAGVGLVDGAHRPVAPFDSWLDTRCGDVVRELADAHGDTIAATSGCAPTVSIGPKMLWWARNHQGLCADAASFVTAAGYVAGRAAGISGHQAFIDQSHLHFTSVADVGSGRWDENLVEVTGVPADLLPRIVDSTTLVGQLTVAAAEDFGLEPGVPVAAGCGDTAAGALGAGVTEPDQAFDIAGTAAVLGVCLSTFAPERGPGTLMTMRAALPGRWYALAYVGGAGQVVEWACREVAGESAGDQDAYAELVSLAATAPAGSDGLLVFPHFSGRVAPVAPAARGAVIGLTPSHGRRHLARATLESIAFEYRGYVEAVRRQVPGMTLTSVTGVGGGSRSALWNQIKADVLGVPYVAVRGVEAGTRGAATVAAVALGHSPWPVPTTSYGVVAEPDRTHHLAYLDAYEEYRWWAEHLVEGFGRTARVAGSRRTEDSEHLTREPES